MKILKQIAGVDVAKDELVASFGRIKENFEKEIISFQIFDNSKKGFGQFIKWVEKMKDPDVNVQIVMEATGVYHQKFAYFLTDHQQQVVIVLPNKISNYARSLNIKTITDKTSSQAICWFGLDRKLDNWEKPQKNLSVLQQLSRETNQVIEQRVMTMNQLHAEKNKAVPHARTIERLEQRIAFLKNQEKDILREMQQIVEADPETADRVELLATIPGIGKASAIAILAETEGFNLIQNKKQLASYAGLDVREKISGTSVKGKPAISKRGNKNLRSRMYFPALSAIRSDSRFRALFIRVTERTGVKMKGVIAVARKLLELSYTIDKNGLPYQKNYEENKKGAKSENEYHSLQASS